MPYFLIAKGTKPAAGWPLIISLHGGGGNAQAKGPHEWQVNTREWQTQLALCQRLYPGDALYFIPRMPDDRDGRWWYDYCQEMYDHIIRRALLFREVDPNRVYVMGISEGGYAAYRLPANQPDRWAAAGAMAAAEPLDTSPPENLGQVAFRCDIGEKDTMFDRIGLARNYFKKLDGLAQGSPGAYLHHFGEQEGRGHGIDYQPCPAWIVKHSRKPRPKQLTWTVQQLHHTLHRHNFWLELAAEPAALPLHLTGMIEANTIILTATAKDGTPVTGAPLRLVLDDDLVKLDEPLKVVLNGATVHDGAIPRRLAVMTRTLAERGDPAMVFTAELDLKAAPAK
jgi:predicted esterase